MSEVKENKGFGAITRSFLHTEKIQLTLLIFLFAKSFMDITYSDPDLELPPVPNKIDFSPLEFSKI